MPTFDVPATDGNRAFDWSDPAGTPPAAIDVIFDRRRSYRRVASIIEVLGLAMLVPLGVLITAAPVLLLIWAGRLVFAWIVGG